PKDQFLAHGTLSWAREWRRLGNGLAAPRQSVSGDASPKGGRLLPKAARLGNGGAKSRRHDACDAPSQSASGTLVEPAQVFRFVLPGRIDTGGLACEARKRAWIDGIGSAKDE